MHANSTKMERLKVNWRDLRPALDLNSLLVTMMMAVGLYNS